MRINVVARFLSYLSVARNSSGVVAGMKFLEVCNNSLSRLTSVAGRFSRTKAACIESIGVRLVSAIVSLAQAADNLGTAFTFSQSRFELSRQGFDDIQWFGSRSFSKEWLKRGYCFLQGCRVGLIIYLSFYRRRIAYVF
jgi:hypothetical protein